MDYVNTDFSKKKYSDYTTGDNLAMSRALQKPRHTFRELERFTVWFEHKRGKSPSHIAKKWGISMREVKSIIKLQPDELRIPLTEIEFVLRRSLVSMVQLQEEALQAIKTEDLEGAALSEKLSAVKIGGDMAIKYDKQVRGDKTPQLSTGLFVSPQERRLQEEKLERHLQKVGFEKVEIETVEEVREEEEEKEDTPQLQLFPGTQETEKKKKEDTPKWEDIFSKSRSLGPGVVLKIPDKNDPPSLDSPKRRTARRNRRAKEMKALKEKK